MDYLLTSVPEKIFTTHTDTAQEKAAYIAGFQDGTHAQAEKMIRLGWISPESVKTSNLLVALRTVNEDREEALREVGEWVKRWAKESGSWIVLGLAVAELESGRMPGKE